MKDNCIFDVETNNLETENENELLKTGLLMAYNLTSKLTECDNHITNNYQENVFLFQMLTHFIE